MQGPIAQLVERCTGSAKVSGSTPLGSIFPQLWGDPSGCHPSATTKNAGLGASGFSDSALLT